MASAHPLMLKAQETAPPEPSVVRPFTPPLGASSVPMPRSVLARPLSQSRQTGPNTALSHVLIRLDTGIVRVTDRLGYRISAEPSLISLDPDAKRVIETSPEAEGLFIAISGAALPHGVRLPALGRAVAASNPDAGAIISLMSQIARPAIPNPQLDALRLGLIAQHLERLDAPARPPYTGPKALVARFTELARTALGSGATIADLANTLGVTSAELDRACLTNRGKRALALVYSLRLEEAARLLRGTDEPPDRIARALGFLSLAHFNRCFAEMSGRLPAQYRAEMHRLRQIQAES